MAVRSYACVALACLAACSSPDELADDVGVEETASVQGAATASAKATGGAARAISQEDDLFIFNQSWPAEVGAIPALADKLDRDAKAVRADMLEEAREERQMRQEEGFPYHPHSYGEEWQVVADLPDWLSLSNAFSTFTGGAHGMYGLESLVWDKRAGRAFDGVELFSSPAVLGEALGRKLCDALDAERLRRRGPEYQPDDSDVFGACPGIEEATVLVGSSNRRTFDRIGIWFGPYVAGPYAEGPFELDFPVDAEVLDAVKPDYRSAFSIRR
jgi:hypothetical protein